MRRNVFGFFVLCAALMTGCADRLAEMQTMCEGTWMLESRTLADGTQLRPPTVQGHIVWVPINSRKAHVTTAVRVLDTVKPTFDYAASVYEISTSAVTQARYALIRQGYRPNAKNPIAYYGRARKAKGKVTLKDDVLEFTHSKEVTGEPPQTFTQTVGDQTMTIRVGKQYTDVWRKL